ncbi:uncharacterized protein GGS22DRAFT_126911 [Annulohypoxylon maeteangense]|uniref:uncharacterized protein n=1 Tax=Annulohypoxylon maeteangense TaxID=1927788 RepID=UPI002008A436|nr:uncharacterized protein GGS22DRAFT_126911 [Annulohypoxylon maeteangense]KAI0886281.1 hypothetical protein GGS22DRAFT_126911 [Annulohypoxylon maeteangense]
MLRFGLFQLLATCASAAYVQWKHCDGYQSKPDGFIPESLSAELVHLNDTHDWLSLKVGGRIGGSECDRWATEVSTLRVEIDSLGQPSSYTSSINATCRLGRNSSFLYLTPTDDLDLPTFFSLSTFHTTIHLVSPDAKEKSCLESNITPAISSNIQATLRYAPFSILLFVLLVGIAQSVTSSNSKLEDESPPPALLPGFADCLQYLQFVFFTGSLSLFYPGFYQPAVSGLGWLSLFSDGIITHGYTYPGVNDGLYEINGTFGGTYGLEIMTQIIGAPTIMDTWLNMVILIAAITTLSALCLGVYSYWHRPVHSGSNSDSDLRLTMNRTLRVVLSYFMLPLIALSFYQLDNVAWLPLYHISLAIFVIAAILAAFIWLLTAIPTRSLGIFIFDNRRRYRQVSPESGTRHHTFVLALFILCFIRGVAIGGLQISGRAQLAVLGTCELILLVCIVQFQAYSMLSIGTISAVVRLGSLICMVAFVPSVASYSARSAIGYFVLVLHASMLLLGFFVPALVQLAKLCAIWWIAPGPDVYSLRQLRKRQASRNHLPERAHSSHTSIDSNVDLGLPAHVEPTHGRSVSASMLRADSPSISSRDYYRPPRHSRLSPSPSMDHHHWKIGAHEIVVSRDPSTDDDSGGRSSDETVSSDSVQSTAMSPETLTSTTETVSLHPRWADYSFRESDLFYGVSRPPSVETPSESTGTPVPSTSQRQTSSSSALNIWRKISGQQATEQGFSVVRPPRPSNSPPI